MNDLTSRIVFICVLLIFAVWFALTTAFDWKAEWGGRGAKTKIPMSRTGKLLWAALAGSFAAIVATTFVKNTFTHVLTYVFAATYIGVFVAMFFALKKDKERHRLVQEQLANKPGDPI